MEFAFLGRTRTLLGVVLLASLAACGGGGSSGGGDSSGSNTGNGGASVGQATIESVSPSTAMLEQAVTFTVSGTNLPLTAMLAMDAADCQAPTGNTSTGFTQVCTPKATGSKLVTIKMAADGSVIDATRSIAVAGGAVATGRLNDTGITSVGYDAAGNYVTTCASAASGNDCNTGRDATANDDADGRAGFSFTKIDADGNELPASATSWACLKDNITGLIWENKTAESGSLTYTNYDSTTTLQYWGAISDAGKVLQQAIDAPTNAVGYMNSVNADGLCGFHDWRIPTVEELHSIVDYSFSATSNTDSYTTFTPTVDAAWFPYIRGGRGSAISAWGQGYYWSSSADWSKAKTDSYRDDYDLHAWAVSFKDGLVGLYGRSSEAAVMLVRAQAGATRQYIPLADGQEVMDTKTGLTWRRCPEGMAWDGHTCSGVAGVYNQIDAFLRAANEAHTSGKAWRLPNVKELGSLVDRSRNSPATDVTVFPTTPAMAFWSSSIASDLGLGVDFGDGQISLNPRGTPSAVRLVRTP